MTGWVDKVWMERNGWWRPSNYALGAAVQIFESKIWKFPRPVDGVGLQFSGVFGIHQLLDVLDRPINGSGCAMG